MSDEREQLDRLRKLKRLRELKARAAETEPQGPFGGGRFRGGEASPETGREGVMSQTGGASGTWELPNPGLPRALMTKFNQGLTRKGSDELVGLIARTQLEPSPGRYLRLQDGSELPARTPGEAQLAFRQGERLNQEAADQHWPKLGFIADMTGEVAGDVALAGSTMVNPLYQAGAGLVRGYFGEDSDAAEDKAVSSGVGLLLGYGFGKLPEVATAASKTRLAQAIANSRAGQMTGDTLRKVARWPGEALDRASISIGRRVLSGAKGLRNEEALADDAVREAMDSGAILPFGTTRGASTRLDGVREEVGEEYVRLVRDLEARGVPGPKAQAVADDWLDKAVQKDQRSLGSSIPGLYLDRAAEVTKKAGTDGRLGLSQSLDITRDLNKQAKHNKLDETLVNRAKRLIASDLRDATEKEVEGAAAASADDGLRSRAARFKPLKRRLGDLIEADEHAFKEAEHIASRKSLGLMEMMSGLGVFGTTQSAEKTVAALIGAHLLKTRGPSTAAYALRGLSKGALGIVENAPQILGEFGAIISGQKTPEARAAMAEELAVRYPQFAQMLEALTRQEGDARVAAPEM